MAFSFTLPELRAELRALGHDGLPDHVILSLLSQLSLPLPSTNAPHKLPHLQPHLEPPCSSVPSSSSYSSSSSTDSGYDTDASTCSDSSCCGDGRAKESTVYKYAELRSGNGNHRRCAVHEPAELLSDDGNPRERTMYDPEELRDENPKRITVCEPAELNLGDGNPKESRALVEPRLDDGNLRKSRAFEEPHLNDENPEKTTVFGSAELCSDGGSPKITGSAEFRLDNGNHKSIGHGGIPNSGTIFGFDKQGYDATNGPHHDKEKGHGKESYTDNMIQHYWISVGEEHMRAMHSKSSKEKQKHEETLISQSGDDNRSMDEAISTIIDNRNSSCGSLIEKVQRCEDELQHLTLSLQARQCRKPRILETVRKPRLSQKKKQEFCHQKSSWTGSISMSTYVKGCENPPLPDNLAFESTPSTEIILSTTYVKASENHTPFHKASCAHVAECRKDVPEKPAMHEEQSQRHAFNIKVEEADMETTPTIIVPALSEHCEREEARQTENKENNASSGLFPELGDDRDPSVCSKSSSGSYQHSRSSGDARSNVSQQSSVRSSGKHPRSGQQQMRRGGKIDRVARFAEMQRVWKKDTFLVANDAGGKRKGVQSFHHLFTALHNSSSKV